MTHYSSQHGISTWGQQVTFGVFLGGTVPSTVLQRCTYARWVLRVPGTGLRKRPVLPVFRWMVLDYGSGQKPAVRAPAAPGQGAKSHTLD